MSEEFALKYAAQRASEKGFSNYRIIYREFIIPPCGTLKFQAHNEIWLLIHIDYGLTVRSAYGRYTEWDRQGITENAHEHGERIEIINKKKSPQHIRFLQVILKTETDGNTR